jgi:hypothetical protein
MRPSLLSICASITLIVLTLNSLSIAVSGQPGIAAPQAPVGPGAENQNALQKAQTTQVGQNVPLTSTPERQPQQTQAATQQTSATTPVGSVAQETGFASLFSAIADRIRGNQNQNQNALISTNAANTTATGVNVAQSVGQQQQQTSIDSAQTDQPIDQPTTTSTAAAMSSSDQNTSEQQTTQPSMSTLQAFQQVEAYSVTGAAM